VPERFKCFSLAASASLRRLSRGEAWNVLFGRVNIADFRSFSANFTENFSEYRPFPRVRAKVCGKVDPKIDDWDRLR
jgi:hypothetical protein